MSGEEFIVEALKVFELRITLEGIAMDNQMTIEEMGADWVRSEAQAILDEYETIGTFRNRMLSKKGVDAVLATKGWRTVRGLKKLLGMFV